MGLHLESVDRRHLRREKFFARHVLFDRRGHVRVHASPANVNGGQGLRRPSPQRGPARSALLDSCLCRLIALLARSVSSPKALVISSILPCRERLVFAWHLWLVSQRAERKQAGVEIVATGVLSLAAPAAYWVGVGHYDPLGWWLWLLTWLQSAASIVHAYMRLEQREQDKGPEKIGRWNSGTPRRAIHILQSRSVRDAWAGAKFYRGLIFIPFLIQWLETMWGIFHPATGWKPTRIGIRQLIVSILWTIAFIIVWQ